MPADFAFHIFEIFCAKDSQEVVKSFSSLVNPNEQFDYVRFSLKSPVHLDRNAGNFDLSTSSDLDQFYQIFRIITDKFQSELDYQASFKFSCPNHNSVSFEATQVDSLLFVTFDFGQNQSQFNWIVKILKQDTKVIWNVKAGVCLASCTCNCKEYLKMSNFYSGHKRMESVVATWKSWNDQFCGFK